MLENGHMCGFTRARVCALSIFDFRSETLYAAAVHRINLRTHLG